MPAVLRRPEETTRRDVLLNPSASAMVFLGAGRPHEVIAIPGVSLDEGEVLVAVELSTVCGSDLHTASGRRMTPVPTVLGHESVARVVAIGDGGARDIEGVELSLGDRVLFSVAVSCGRCDRCAHGIPQKCRDVEKYGHARIAPHWELVGGFASHVHLRRGTVVVRVEETLPASVLAPVGCAYATAWAALERADDLRDVAGARVLVSGAGLVGLAASAMARTRGAVVTVADPDAGRRERARRFGAADVVDPREGLPAELDIVIEASGAPVAVRAAIDALGVGGAAILVGSVFDGDEVAFDPASVVRRLATVAGVHNYTPDDLSDAVRWVHRHASDYPLADVVGRVLPLTDVDAALALAASGEHLRVGLDPRASR